MTRRIAGERLNMFGDVEQHVNYFTRRSIRHLVGLHPDLTLLGDFHPHTWSVPLHRLAALSTGNFLIKKVQTPE